LLVLCMYMPWYLYALLGLIALDVVAIIVGIIVLKRTQDEKKLARYIELYEVIVLINISVLIVIEGAILVDKLRINPCECGCEP